VPLLLQFPKVVSFLDSQFQLALFFISPLSILTFRVSPSIIEKASALNVFAFKDDVSSKSINIDCNLIDAYPIDN